MKRMRMHHMDLDYLIFEKFVPLSGDRRELLQLDGLKPTSRVMHGKVYRKTTFSHLGSTNIILKSEDHGKITATVSTTPAFRNVARYFLTSQGYREVALK